MKRSLWIATLSMFFLCGTGLPQDEEEEAYQAFKDAADDNAKRIALRSIALLEVEKLIHDPEFAKKYLFDRFREEIVQPVEFNRFDKQDGAAANAGGGTALASRVATPNLLSLALESGALQRSTQGSIVTFRVNALGAYRWLSATPAPDCSLLLVSCASDDANPFRGLSVAASLDASRDDHAIPANGDTALLLRPKNTLSAASVRYELFRRRRYDGKDYRTQWEKAIDDFSKTGTPAELSKAINTVFQDLIGDQAYVAFRESVVAELVDMAKDTPKETLQNLVTERARKYVEGWLNVPENRSNLTSAYEKLNQYRQARDGAIKDAVFRKSFTAEYAYQRPLDQPEYSNVLLIGGFPFGQWAPDPDDKSRVIPLAELTFNAGFNFYHSQPAGTSVGGLRDAQVALQLDRKLYEFRAMGKPVFTLAGYYQYMFDNAVIQFNQESKVPGLPIELPGSAMELLNTKGSIGIIQVKLTFPIGNSGVSVPVAVTWSNRTELIKASEVRGQFGFTFNLDKILVGK